MGDSQQHYDVHNNVHSNYNAHGHIKKSYIKRKCIQLYSKVKYNNLMRPLYEHGELTMVTKKY
jgi:hypothetical protein